MTGWDGVMDGAGDVLGSVASVASVTGPVLQPEVLCAAAGAVAGVVADPAGDEQLLRLLESAVAQLHGVVEELRLVGADTRGMAESVRALNAMEWHSPAGEAFAERNHRLWVRATDLAEVAEESVHVASAAIGELQQQIARLRETLQAARAAMAAAVTLGVC